ncbi:MAG: class I SAM-dependent methyltransferase, partial [Nitrospinota bacterium]
MSSCLLCGSESHQEVFREPHAFFEEEEYVLVRCTGCGLMRAEPPLPVDYHEAALPEDYSEEDVEDYLFRKRLGEFGKKLSLIHKFKRGGRLLDVGCHLGHFMRFAQREGWDVWGLDVADGYTAYAREKGLKNVFITSLREARLQENFFDVVTIWNTLEHLSQPLEELKEVNRILKREGIIALSLPCARYVRLKVFFLSRVPLLRGLLFPDLESLLPHTHLFNFTPKTAEALLA